MRLFLIRHGESEHNVASKLAGVTDSALTNHGVLQTQRLGRYLADAGVQFTKIYSSDLQRARITADSVAQAQLQLRSRTTPGADGLSLGPLQLPVLREQDFGFYEGKPWTLSLPDVITAGDPRNDPGFKDKETTESIATRANLFLDGHLLQLLEQEPEVEQEHVVAVVSHGVTLSFLWRCLLMRFGPNTVTIGPTVTVLGGFRPLEYLPGWSNTGYLELDIKPLKTGAATSDPRQHAVMTTERTMSNVALQSSAPSEKSSLPESAIATSTPGRLQGWSMVVKTVNGKEHLNNLKRTGGGVGSAKHDEKQTKLEGFFKKEPSM